MENRESSYYRRDGASRPPQRDGAASRRESTLFTELPIDSVRRTLSSGRPVQPRSDPYRQTAQPRQTDPYYNAVQQADDPYRRSNGTYRQPYATGGYRAAP